MDALLIGIGLFFILALLGVLAGLVYALFFRGKNTTGHPGGNPRAHVVCIAGPSKGKQAKFKDGIVTIGRSDVNSIIVNEPLVSNRHAELRYRDGRFLLEDLNSGNGVWINGRRISQEALFAGTVFQIGASSYQFLMPNQRAGDTVFPSPATAPIPPPGAAASPPRTLAKGFSNLNNYELGRLIAEGGQANVHRARSRIDGSEVVIKFFNAAGAGSHTEYMRQKFEQQLVIGATIRHPHCVRILGGNPYHDPPYLVEELLTGGTLGDVMRAGRKFSPEDLSRVIGQCCDALTYLHKRMLIHRDLSPGNIMFGQDGLVRIIDFGIAQNAGQATRTQLGMIIGKARYMSVEQARGDSAVPQSDLYSLGIIAYELLTGHVPFEGEPMDILARHLKEQPRPVNEVVPGVPERLSRAIMRALEKDANRRFANAEEMARAFGYTQPFNEGAVSQTGAENVMGEGLVMGVDAIRLRNAQNGKVIEVKQSPLMLSRDVVGSADPNMSRRHGQLLFRDKLWWVMEIPGEKPSTNGIYRNGVRVTEPEGQFLSAGDEIRLGETLLKVET